MLLALALAAGACAPKKLPPPAAAVAPAFPTFERPELIEPLPVPLPAAVSQRYDAGWTSLQAGRPEEASATFTEVIGSTPAFYPARAAHGYARLAARDINGAVTSFDAALAARPGYLPALAGRAEALIAGHRDVEAIGALEALIAADPQRTAARTRLETLRLQVIEGLVAEARAARQRNDLDAARTAWTRAVEASPDSADFLRELAQVERQAGQLDAALTHARAALLLDDGDAPTQALVGELESARGNLRPALEAYTRAAARDPRPEYRARIEDLERRIDLAGMPGAFRSIGERGAISRGDLAALLGARLEPLLAAARTQPIPLMTDVRGHWAQRWILDVARAGVMEVFPNHTFQPGRDGAPFRSGARRRRHSRRACRRPIPPRRRAGAGGPSRSPTWPPATPSVTPPISRSKPASSASIRAARSPRRARSPARKRLPPSIGSSALTGGRP